MFVARGWPFWLAHMTCPSPSALAAYQHGRVLEAPDGLPYKPQRPWQPSRYGAITGAAGTQLLHGMYVCVTTR
jgi:hypothetical protein